MTNAPARNGGPSPGTRPRASFTGQLMDVARTGFRAHHDRLSLGSGQLVEFQMARRHGRARAVWTRILDGKAETGFRIVAQGKD